MIVYHIKLKKQNLSYKENFSYLTYFNCFGIFKMKFMRFLVIRKNVSNTLLLHILYVRTYLL